MSPGDRIGRIVIGTHVLRCEHRQCRYPGKGKEGRKQKHSFPGLGSFTQVASGKTFPNDFRHEATGPSWAGCPAGAPLRDNLLVGGDQKPLRFVWSRSANRRRREEQAASTPKGQSPSGPKPRAAMQVDGYAGTHFREP